MSTKKAPENKPSDHLPYDPSNKKWWTAEPDGVHVLQEAKTGPASYGRSGTPLLTVPQVFEAAVKANGTNVALATEGAAPLNKGEKPPPGLPLAQWKTWTWDQYHQQVRLFAKACIAVGMAPHESVNIFGFNSPEWGIAMFGAMFAGGKAAGIYPSDTEESVKYKSDHSNGVVAVVEGVLELNKFKAVIDELPKLAAIVCWACPPGEDITTKDGRKVKTFSFEEFLKIGSEVPEEDLVTRLGAINAGHACVLVYTSGTTGRPKAVMICHDSLNYAAATVLAEPKVIGEKASDRERVVSYLPLSHVAGMMVDLFAPLILSANFKFRGSFATYFARPYDLKIGTLVDRLKAVRPTLFLGVPRVWEKVGEKLKAVGASGSAVQKMVGAYAKKRGALYTSSRQLGQKKRNPKTMFVATFILNKIKQKLGLDKSKFMFSGAAPLAMDVLQYFGSLKININEVYGMSETCGMGTWSTDNHHLWGSVGYEAGGCEIRVLNKANLEEVKRADDIFHATEEEQGEICFKGRNIMMGYMANPRFGKDHVAELEKKNSDAIDTFGWLHSGDKGTKGKNGMYKITGRYKEIIIGAAGENIAPVPIEDELKAQCPLLSNVMMIGNQRKFNVMLVTLKVEGSTGEVPGGNKLEGAAATLSKSKTIEEAADDEVFIKEITAAINRTNGNKDAVPSNAAKVQKFTILPRDFSVETGELTATLKLKRSVVEEEFAPIIDKMYEIDTTYVNYKLAPTKGLEMGTEEPKPRFEKNLSFNMNAAAEEGGIAAEKEVDAEA